MAAWSGHWWLLKDCNCINVAFYNQRKNESVTPREATRETEKKAWLLIFLFSPS